MAARQTARITREVRPLLSLDNHEARLRVLGLYRAWFRQIPYMVRQYSLIVDEDMARAKLRQKFMEHAHVQDIRVIDMLVVKGQQDLKEVAENWAMPTHIISKFFKVTVDDRPKDFMSKFLSGQD
ncbi:hypothetical protein TCAL_06837 [Tigriopus californicus]|uniref:NADH dehydrogenase [ubiquinone] 1 alpha subcomplex subunit 6 n=2 Tax=Tigriopus californicus TaxID=6832 RepID=A0A553NTY6_TIGCA|nr:hypothetical protein TCAL_06837 [Tigriopus californicus]